MPDDVPTYGTAPVDDDVVDLGVPAADSTTELDDLTSEFEADTVQTVTLPVPGRPRYQAVYRLNFTDKDLDGWRKGAKDKGYSDGVSGSKFAALLLGATCERILRDGEPLEVDGKVARFTSRAFLNLLGASTVVIGVRKFYGLEGIMQQAAGAVQRAAGWLEPLEETPDDLDPS